MRVSGKPKRDGQDIVVGDEARVQQKQDEELVVVLAHAVRHPRAVVVHLFDAAPAHAAMVATLRLIAAANLAETSIAHGIREPSLQRLQRVGPLARGRVPWLGEDGAQVGADRTDEQKVSHSEVGEAERQVRRQERSVHDQHVHVPRPAENE